MSNSGLVYVFTGDGKGKTSAALGVAMRAAGQGKRVAMVQWYKERRSEVGGRRSEIPIWRIGEHHLPELLKKPLFEIYPMGQGFYKLPTDHAGEEEHHQAANKALKLAAKLLSANQQLTINNQQLFLLVLDEALNAVADKLIQLNQLIELISHRGSTHVILTGRSAPKELIVLADLVTEMKNLKHPYDFGKKAIMGLDY